MWQRVVVAYNIRYQGKGPIQLLGPRGTVLVKKRAAPSNGNNTIQVDSNRTFLEFLLAIIFLINQGFL